MSDTNSQTRPNGCCMKIVGIEDRVHVIHVADTEEKFLKTPVTRLKKIIHEKFPEIEPDCMRLLFAGKQLADTGDAGAECTLEDYNIQTSPMSTVHLVIRVHGGSDTPKQFKERVPAPPTEEKRHDPSDFSLMFTDEPDVIFGYSLPGDPKRVKMSCGHAVDPNTLTGWCRSLLDSHHFKFHCPAIVGKDANGIETQCKKEWEYAEVRRIALLNEAECSYFESKMAEYAALQYCDMKECPGCRSFVERIDLTNLRVTCPVCTKKKKSTYDFCWQCEKEWSAPPVKSGLKCGNPKCEHPELPSVRDSPMFTLNGKQVPIRRACPTCGRVVEHMNDQTCKFMICPRCKNEYCFMCLETKQQCLRKAPGNWFKECSQPVAAKQTSIPVWASVPPHNR